mgnify:CR=1 FL=1
MQLAAAVRPIPRASDISDRILASVERASGSRRREVGTAGRRRAPRLEIALASFGSVPEGRATTLTVSPLINTASVGGSSSLPGARSTIDVGWPASVCRWACA